MPNTGLMLSATKLEQVVLQEASARLCVWAVPLPQPPQRQDQGGGQQEDLSSLAQTRHQARNQELGEQHPDQWPVTPG